MDKGSYVAASGGFAQLLKMQIVSNNLANVNTPGFKKQVLIGREQSFEETLAAATPQVDPYAKGDFDRAPSLTEIRTETDFTQGPIQQTNNPLDVALRNENEFFVISTRGGPRYTRAGNFTLNSGGQLVTADGNPVSGDGGPITLPPGPVNIQQDGSIFVNGENAARLQVVRIDRPATMIREEGSRFSLQPGTPPPAAVEADVIPGALEGANINMVGTMVDLISVNRAFEMYTRMAQSIDRLNQISIAEVGRR